MTGDVKTLLEPERLPIARPPIYMPKHLYSSSYAPPLLRPVRSANGAKQNTHTYIYPSIPEHTVLSKWAIGDVPLRRQRVSEVSAQFLGATRMLFPMANQIFDLNIQVRLCFCAEVRRTRRRDDYGITRFRHH